MLCDMPRTRTPSSSSSASRLLPCLVCRSSKRALEELVCDYFAYVRGERRLRFDDDRVYPHLPRTCCKQQPKADVDVGMPAPAPDPVAAAPAPLASSQ